jgi:hypothetical protein
LETSKFWKFIRNASAESLIGRVLTARRAKKFLPKLTSARFFAQRRLARHLLSSFLSLQSSWLAVLLVNERISLSQ